VLRRSGSSSSLTSLTSLVDPATGEGRIRVCFYCKELLERRDRQMEVGGTKPLLVQLYDELRGHMDPTSSPPSSTCPTLSGWLFFCSFKRCGQGIIR